jgi:60 kDa SS-A/Ro ribonucleoprotein
MGSLAVAMRKTLGDFGGTDCALPMLWAAQQKVPVDVFVCLTDNETWAGGTHPSIALENYRQKMGINAGMAVVGMVSNGFSVADPADPKSVDIVGFDAAVPQVLNC